MSLGNVHPAPSTVSSHPTQTDASSSSIKSDFQICSRCVLDTTAQDIWFDEAGVCKYCHIHDRMQQKYPDGDEGRKKLAHIVREIKRDGRGKRYDCIVGVSGGRDSTYTLLQAKRLGLRPLAVHFDNGWNSDTAVSNIQRATARLEVDLDTHVADWEEFKDLQVAFLKAAVPDADVPTDWVIHSVLYAAASRERVRYVLNGHSFRTEGTTPISWTYMDGKYVKSVHRQFGTKRRLRSFPIVMLHSLVYHSILKRIRVVNLLEHMDYDKSRVDPELERELGWEYYGGHHHENLFTKFFQSYYLPTKFGIDKRKREFAAAARSGAMTRDEALQRLAEPYEYDPELVHYVRSKLSLSEVEFDAIMRAPIRSFADYPNYLSLLRTLGPVVRTAVRLGVLPEIVSLKYLDK